MKITNYLHTYITLISTVITKNMGVSQVRHFVYTLQCVWPLVNRITTLNLKLIKRLRNDQFNLIVT